MKKFSFILIGVFALSSAKPWDSNTYNGWPNSYPQEGYFDQEGYYHRAKAMSYNYHPYRIASVQQKAGLSRCQSAEHESEDITSYVHVCSAGKDSTGKLHTI